MKSRDTILQDKDDQRCLSNSYQFKAIAFYDGICLFCNRFECFRDEITGEALIIYTTINIYQVSYAQLQTVTQIFFVAGTPFPDGNMYSECPTGSLQSRIPISSVHFAARA